MSEDKEEKPQRDYRRKNKKTGTVTKTGVVVGRGENQKVIPVEEVEALAKLWCSYTEIADWFGIPIETLKYNFKEVIDRGKSETKQSLRRAQIKSALEGNTTMLIWLGKNILGQTDSKVEVEQTNKVLPWTDDDTKPTEDTATNDEV